METKNFKVCVLCATDRIRELRQDCEKYKVPEHIQDGYEDIIDKLLCFLGITEKQKELFWTLTDPE